MTLFQTTTSPLTIWDQGGVRCCEMQCLTVIVLDPRAAAMPAPARTVCGGGIGVCFCWLDIFDLLVYCCFCWWGILLDLLDICCRAQSYPRSSSTTLKLGHHFWNHLEAFLHVYNLWFMIDVVEYVPPFDVKISCAVLQGLQAWMDALPGVFTYASDCLLVLPRSALCGSCLWANQRGPAVFDFVSARFWSWCTLPCIRYAFSCCRETWIFEVFAWGSFVDCWQHILLTVSAWGSFVGWRAQVSFGVQSSKEVLLEVECWEKWGVS